MTFHRRCDIGNILAGIIWAGTAYPSGAPKFQSVGCVFLNRRFLCSVLFIAVIMAITLSVLQFTASGYPFRRLKLKPGSLRIFLYCEEIF